MKNVTVTMDEDLLVWARVEAAKQGQSLSRFVAQTLAERRSPDIAARLAALDTFLDGPGWPGIAENLPKRDDLYDRPALLRHEPDRLRDGSAGSGAEGTQCGADPGSAVAPPPRRKPADS
ncbi:hypothetical protein [Methylobacterium nigriterrae]|uniref:hypothetical protein n=1 Tax=Methylobacterium nigriterrae TaxID=3127512 RepID=UPI00301339B6